MTSCSPWISFKNNGQRLACRRWLLVSTLRKKSQGKVVQVVAEEVSRTVTQGNDSTTKVTTGSNASTASTTIDVDRTTGTAQVRVATWDQTIGDVRDVLLAVRSKFTRSPSNRTFELPLRI